MRIDITKLKKSTSEVPVDCKALIDKLTSCNADELLIELKKIETWTYGKCELYHWVEVLNVCDHVLEEACKKEDEQSWILACDLVNNKQRKDLLLWTLHFTTLLIEHSFSRHLYNSMEHLTNLMASSDMNVVLGVLNLLYMFSKRSNFITRLPAEKRQELLSRLLYLAESWGGSENGFGLAECCSDVPVSQFPPSATTLHFEYYAESGSDSASKKNNSGGITCIQIHIPNIDLVPKSPSSIMEELLENYNVPKDKQMVLFTYIRLAHAFSDYKKRLQFIQARLQALSVLVYSSAVQDNLGSLLYNGFLEELVEVLELKQKNLMEIKAAALRTLTAIIHLDRNPSFPKLNTIIDVTEASSYHGFLPVLVRSCIGSLINSTPDNPPFPLPFATALFSFLYHLASYEAGVEALVSCGMMESLLKVINWRGTEPEHSTFVTRAVRVIDLITNLDMHAFQMHSGLPSFINRLEVEVNDCKKEQPFVYQSRQSIGHTEQLPNSTVVGHLNTNPIEDTNDPLDLSGDQAPSAVMDVENIIAYLTAGPSCQPDINLQPKDCATRPILTCIPQRAALLKSILNFLKKAIGDSAASDSIRHLMDGSLPSSLKHIISNAEYYGPSLFLLATDTVAMYVFQEPSLLSSLQQNGLTDAVLYALLVKDVPATREVLASLPNVFSALCLNAQGLEAFVNCKPFDKLFRVLLSPDYLPAMRRRRSSDPMGDTASNLGNAMDELMRHQPSLRKDATAAIVKLLTEICNIGKDPKYVCCCVHNKTEQPSSSYNRTPVTEGGSSDEEEEEEEDESSSSHATGSGSQMKDRSEVPNSVNENSMEEKISIPLIDYILNVMKFVESILSNNATDDHCREFVSQNGLTPLMNILGLPNLPIDFPVTPACHCVASVCKSVLNLASEPRVLKEGLIQLSSVLQILEPLHVPLGSPGGSVLLHELASSPDIDNAFNNASSTPLLHAMSAAHGYIMMFVHVCRSGQSDNRSISISHWGSELGLGVLKGLSQLYTSLVWESTILLALCNEDGLPPGCLFGREDLDKLVPSDIKNLEDGLTTSNNLIHSIGEFGSNGVTSAMQALTTESSVTMDLDDQGEISDTGDKDLKTKFTLATYHKVKLIKPLLGASSRLGRALAELFGLLVKLCVGSPLRQRRGQTIPPIPSPPTLSAQSVASALANLLTEGLSWEPPPTSPVPKFRLTYFICSMGFTSPMLFDEKKFPYNLMLQKFRDSGGQKAFFDTFKWALSCGSQISSVQESQMQPSLPEGTAEFLESWLTLLEKLVNPKSILETPHILPGRSVQVGYKPFDPLKYLISIQKDTFDAVMILWNRKPLEIYGSRIAESMLTILCHILKGGAIIKEKLKKEKDQLGPSSANPSTSNGTRRREEQADPEVDPHHLQQLMDMGFSRENCIEALHYTRSVEQATDYLLSHPPLVRAPVTDGVLTEDDQVMRAIAMSLGVKVTGDQNKDDNQELSDGDKSKGQDGEADPLSDKVIDDFTSSMLPGCFRLSDSLQDTVYKVCDLLTAVVSRNGDQWRDGMLLSLLNEINENVHELMKLASGSLSPEVMAQLTGGKHALRAARRLHLFTLMFEKMKIPGAQIVEKSNLLADLISLITLLYDCISTYPKSATPSWLAPAVLFIDLYEKIAIGSSRRSVLQKVTNHTWKWFEVTSGKWCTYSAGNNKIIDDAFWNGDPSVRVTAGRRKYIIQFITMTQINEETGNRRPIMLALREPDKASEKKKADSVLPGSTLPATDPGSSSMNHSSCLHSASSFVTPSDGSSITFEPLDGSPLPSNDLKRDEQGCPDVVNVSKPKEEEMDVDEPSKKEAKEMYLPVVSGLLPHEAEGSLKACVKLITVPVDPDTLHAILRLCLRLSRNHKLALQFAEMGGVRMLLNLTHSSEFSGFTSLATLLIRHMMEEPATLRYTMEKVIRGSTNVRARELHYLLRALAPAASRAPELFEEISKAVLRVDLSLVAKRGDELEDQRLLIKSIPPKSGVSVPTLSGTVRNVLSELLNALACRHDVAEPAQQDNIPTTQDKPKEEDHSKPCDSLLVGQSVEESSKIPGPKEEEKHDKVKIPLFPKSAICRLLAELVKSYVGCAKLISEYVICSGVGELVTEDCNVLAFILDNLLPPCQTVGDTDTPTLAKTLLAALASCNHSPDAQNILVAEVKASLLRTLNLPESVEKHSRIQSLTGLILLMIESCPSSVAQAASTSSFKQQTMSMNNIVKIIMRRGLVTDLAKIPHSLDLSSPHMATTVNSSLKPLETLSRIINLPLNTNIPRLTSKMKSASETNVEEMASVQTGISDSDATHAQREENIGDTDNTDHDISTVTESLDHNSESQTHEEAQEERDGTLDEIIDQLLERDGVHHDDSLLSDALMANHPSQNPMESDDAMHDSQMMTQHESEFETEDTQCEEHGDSSTSGSEHSDEGDEDGEDEDEDEEEEEEDEEGSAYEDDGEGDEFREAEEAFYRASLPPFSDAETEVFGENNRSMQLPLALNDDSTASPSDTLAQSLAPPSSIVTPISHPLLNARQSNENNAVAVGRVHRAGRQGRYRYIQLTTSMRDSNPPAILQRLLGPGFAHDVFHLTASHRFTSGMREARMLFSENDFRYLTGTDDALVDFQAHEDGLLGSQSTLSSIPTALVRWAEASRVLDGDSVHDCLTILKPSIIELLEKIRNEELAEKILQKKKEEEASAQIKKMLDEELKKSDAMDMNGFDDSSSRSTSQEGALQNSESAVTTTAPDVNISTENFAESIVESVLRPAFSTSTTVSLSQPPTTVTPVSAVTAFYPPTSDSSQVSANNSFTSNSSLGLLPVDLRSFFDILASEIGYPENSNVVSSADMASTITTLSALSSASTSTSVVPTISTPVITTSPWNVPDEPIRLLSNLPSSQTVVNSSVPQCSEENPSNLPTEQTNAELVPMSDTVNVGISVCDTGQTREAMCTPNDGDGLVPHTEEMEVESNLASENTKASDTEVLTVQDVLNDPIPISTTIPNLSGMAENLQDSTTSAVAACASTSGEPCQSVTTTVGSDGVDYSEVLGNIEIPEGVDPAFLAALPDDMRQEVITEQLRLKQRAESQSQSAVGASSSVSLEVNPEFLAALPLNIQEEVLAQQRLEQQRQQAATSNPEDPVDPANFISTLPPALRQTVLSDMEESQMAVLPPDLAAEAQNLRREWEARNRQIMHDRMFTSNGTATLSSILRNTVGRLGSRFPFQAVTRGQWNGWNSRTATTTIQPPNLRLRGRQLLDHEALSCLLILLFIDDSKLNTNRLHRVMRNLCYHAPTRDWVIKSLLSILEKAGDTRSTDTTGDVRAKNLKSATTSHENLASSSSSQTWVESKSGWTPSWLNISMDAALGCRANVFMVMRNSQTSGKKQSTDKQYSQISLHSQASPIICRHVLDTLISLAKSFPNQFLPTRCKDIISIFPACKDGKDKDRDIKDLSDNKCKSVLSSSGGSNVSVTSTKHSTDFWDMLGKLDSMSASKKGKSITRTHSGIPNLEEAKGCASFESSPLGQLIGMLSQPVIQRSSVLTDKLLRLLALISLGLPYVINSSKTGDKSRETAVDSDLSYIVINENLLKLAVDVLTSKNCSEEGLEDGTALLLRLSQGPAPTRDLVLNLLLCGASELGNTVQVHIHNLETELQELNKKSHVIQSDEELSESSESIAKLKSYKGVLRDRFTKEAVIITVPSRPKGGSGGELQLQSMMALTSKTSSQSFFLRILKVVIQLREAARLATLKEKDKKKGNTNPPSQATSENASTVDSVTPSTELSIPDGSSVTCNPSDANTEHGSMADAIPPAAQTAEESNASSNSQDTENMAEDNGTHGPTPMDVDNTILEDNTCDRKLEEVLPPLSEQLNLEHLWTTLSECLKELAGTPDHHAVLVLQPAVEAFFLVHASGIGKDDKGKQNKSESKESQLSHLQQDLAPLSPVPASNESSSSNITRDNSIVHISPDLPPDTKKFLEFAETHRTVLNQILRQSTVHLADGPFSVLVDHTRILDFDVKRRYFRTELERMDEGIRREDLAIHVKREHVFEDSFRELHRRSPEEWKNRFYVVFEGEEGQDAGGLLREWYMIISREIFNPMYALFTTSPGDRVTYMINPSSHCNSNHLSYFKFVGRVIAKAVYDNKLLECYFTRSFYKHILGKAVRYTDMESEDYSFYQGLAFLVNHHVSELGYDLTFSTEVQEFGVTEVRDLITNGRNIPVVESNKLEYIRLVCQMKMTGAIRKQLNAFLEGFYDIIPKRLISIFNEQELELLISGLPNIDIDDLKSNTEYHKYQANSLQIQWLWRALRSFDQADRAKFLQFVTGTSKVPLQGFASLEGMNGIQKFQVHRDDRSTERLPSAHTCFNQLDLPVYETYDKLKCMLLKAINECSEGFGFA